VRDRTPGLGGALAAVLTVAAFGCGQSPITSARIEGAIAPTFANLVHVQLSRLGVAPVGASEIAVTAHCRKLMTASGATGAGAWECTLIWRGPYRRPLVDTYDVSVATSGCYTASVDGADAHLGGPTLKASDGRDLRNLLYAFEGCFDTN
jgi:hypothetical protein